MILFLSAADDDADESTHACSDCGKVRCVGGCTNRRRSTR